jgi:hypothetical protein
MQFGIRAGPKPPGGPTQRDQHQEDGGGNTAAEVQEGTRDARSSAGHPLVGCPAHPEGSHRVGDILDPLLAEGGHRNVQPLTDLIAHRARNADASGIGQRLQSRGNVDAVAKQVRPFDNDVTKVNPDPQPHLLRAGTMLVFDGDRFLDGDSAFDGVDRAGEIRDHAVPCSIEDPAPMRRDQSIKYRSVGLQRPPGADIIPTHEPAVVGNIGRENRGELSFDHLAFCHRSSVWATVPQSTPPATQYSLYSIFVP